MLANALQVWAWGEDTISGCRSPLKLARPNYFAHSILKLVSSAKLRGSSFHTPSRTTDNNVLPAAMGYQWLLIAGILVSTCPIAPATNRNLYADHGGERIGRSMPRVEGISSSWHKNACNQASLARVPQEE